MLNWHGSRTFTLDFYWFAWTAKMSVRNNKTILLFTHSFKVMLRANGEDEDRNITSATTASPGHFSRYSI